MTWIKTLSYDEADDRLRKLYDRVKGEDGQVDRILQAHGLRPHSLQGHMTLYKNVLHHSGNTLPRWLLEALGVYVSILNGCRYCVDHHYQGMMRLLADETRSTAIAAALEEGVPERVFSGRELALIRYAERLTLDPRHVDEALVATLKDEGLDDGEILEANQVIAYFAYANRTVLGLGVRTDGERLGLAPVSTEDPEDWGHR